MLILILVRSPLSRARTTPAVQWAAGRGRRADAATQGRASGAERLPDSTMNVALHWWPTDEGVPLAYAHTLLRSSLSFQASRLIGGSFLAALGFQPPMMYYLHMATVIENRLADGRTYRLQ